MQLYQLMKGYLNNRNIYQLACMHYDTILIELLIQLVKQFFDGLKRIIYRNLKRIAAESA
ncbi:MAG: hypothetical protein WKF89_18780 [Chitinophagaceae bacterium]